MFKSFFYTKREKEIFRVTIIGSTLNILLMGLKFVAGIWGHSSAMIADAANSLSDIITDITMLIFIRISSKPSDEKHRYGHGKYETLSSALIAGAMIVLGASLLANSAETIIGVFYREETILHPEKFALIIAIISILSKFIVFRYTKKESRVLKSSGLRAKAYDHGNDVFTSLAVLIGICAAMFLDNRWAILEPVAAALVSIIIIYTGIKLLIPAFEELLEKSLPREVEDQIHALLLEEKKILNYHRLRTRSIGSRYAIEVDIRVHGYISVCEAHDITKQIEDRLREKFGEQTHIIIHVEPEEEVDRDAD
ncbi:cation diffusion facilitator family transporter [Porphyromonas macacae]|uniref:Cation diffusion facilitator family transporter n=2 Tax=Porphyromonas macacae TaxID=28115 RepID=A0A0A2ECN9_9PORP|nr:cation diffusion facilitator family transporter [Porphyromonas macacae]KGN74209.1 cation diffusion facilitator family transporter [Porphyromonas macacae]KGN97184.1 cation diffusion facilitator family transporter [Porphyromonas macacae]SUB88816.1 Ferrous-iron efflux pump FieF [Porphyromonas macacae]